MIQSKCSIQNWLQQQGTALQARDICTLKSPFSPWNWSPSPPASGIGVYLQGRKQSRPSARPRPPPLDRRYGAGKSTLARIEEVPIQTAIILEEIATVIQSRLKEVF